MKKYKVKSGGTDVFAISLVEEPAVESNFVALAKQDEPKPVYLEKEDKHMLYGIILRADFPIYRNDSYGEYTIEFDADTIERLERKFMKNYAQKSWTTDHSMYADGLTLTESWIVTDLEHDKSNALGLEGVTVGSWVGGCLVDDTELWAQVKDGDFKGFSIEAFCNLEELNLSKINKTNKEDMKNEDKILETLDEIKAMLQKEEPVEKTEEKPVEEKFEETVTEEPVEEPKTEEPVEEKLEEEKPEEPKADEPEETKVEENLSETVEQLKSEIETLKTENTELKGKVEKMGKMPSVEPNKTPSGEKKFSAIEQLDKLGFIKW